jgi:hypothetical protein
LPGLSQWFFTTEEVQSTPSIVEGVPPSEERLRRAKGVNFIYQAGVMLDLPQITLWVAGVLFHRFYMRYSMEPSKGGIHHYVSSPAISMVLIHELTSIEHIRNSALPSEQGRGELPKDERHHHRCCQGRTEEHKTRY